MTLRRLSSFNKDKGWLLGGPLLSLRVACMCREANNGNIDIGL
jgi:hypothetical protein